MILEGWRVVYPALAHDLDTGVSPRADCLPSEMTEIDLLPDDEEEEVDMLGGLVVFLAGRVPQRGELISHPAGLEFEVREADPRRIKRLHIHVRPTI